MRDDLIRERERKLEEYRKAADPYPAEAKRSGSISEILEDFSRLLKSKKTLFVAGRILAWRDQGGIIFADLRDESGGLQVVFNERSVKNFKLIKGTFDTGDIIEAKGTLFTTERGEKSLLAKETRVLTKSLRPIPATWYGLEDVETRLRKRYLDLLARPELRELFKKKSVFWDAARDFLKDEGFLEVETPVLQPMPGGAEAEPFKTHHNALDTDFYLRIALELPLKKLLVGGFEKVFEIGRVFRNEGIDREHLQDFTFLEFYWAYHDYNDLMTLLEKMFKEIIKKTCGGLKTEFGGKKIDWSKKWSKIDYVKIFQEESGIDPLSATLGELFKKAKELGLNPEKNLGKGRLIDLIYKKTVRPKLIEPGFLIDPPAELVPLAKRLEKDPRQVARTQIVACGTELGNGYTELNDPIDQRKRFEEQVKLREEGDEGAQRLDEDFLEALEYGMPPAAGFGMSERLFAVLVDKPVRETVLFPLMRREQ